MEKAPVKIDTLLEPLLLEISDGQADELLLQIINVHAEPVIKGVSATNSVSARLVRRNKPKLTIFIRT